MLQQQRKSMPLWKGTKVAACILCMDIDHANSVPFLHATSYPHSRFREVQDQKNGDGGLNNNQQGAQATTQNRECAPSLHPRTRAKESFPPGKKKKCGKADCWKASASGMADAATVDVHSRGKCRRIPKGKKLTAATMAFWNMSMRRVSRAMPTACRNWPSSKQRWNMRSTMASSRASTAAPSWRRSFV